MPCRCLWYEGGTPCTVTTLLSCWGKTRRHDQSLQQSLACDPGLKETVQSAEIKDGLFNLPQADARDVAFGPN